MRSLPKTNTPLLVSTGLLGVSLALSSAGGCNGCGTNNHSFPVQDGAAEYPIERGAVGISVDFTDCPSTPAIQLTPDSAKVGEAVMLSVLTPVPDAGTWAVKWTAPTNSGTFSQPSATTTTFSCAMPGPITLTLSLTSEKCSSSQEVSFFCLGQRDAGMLEVSSGSGGSGMTGTGGNSGTGGGPAPMVANKCPDSEPTSGPGGGTACFTCAKDNCSLAPSPSGTDGCCGLAKPADQALCIAVYSCVASHAATCIKENDPNSCHCGTSGADCFMISGAANGPCVSEVQAAAKSGMASIIQSQFTSPASPLGRGINLAACLSSFCQTECGLEPAKK